MTMFEAPEVVRTPGTLEDERSRREAFSFPVFDWNPMCQDDEATWNNMSLRKYVKVGEKEVTAVVKAILNGEFVKGEDGLPDVEEKHQGALGLLMSLKSTIIHEVEQEALDAYIAARRDGVKERSLEEKRKEYSRLRTVEDAADAMRLGMSLEDAAEGLRMSAGKLAILLEDAGHGSVVEEYPWN